MKKKPIAIFLSTFDSRNHDNIQAINEKDIEIIHDLTTYFDIDVYCDDPIPDENVLLPCSLSHYLLFYKKLPQNHYQNVLFFIWGSGINQYMFTLIDDFPGIIILRDKLHFQAFSDYYVEKNDFIRYLDTLYRLWGKTGTILGVSQLLGLPTTDFIQKNIGFEVFFCERSRRVIVNYPLSDSQNQLNSIVFIPHHINKNEQIASSTNDNSENVTSMNLKYLAKQYHLHIESTSNPYPMNKIKSSNLITLEHKLMSELKYLSPQMSSETMKKIIKSIDHFS